MASFNDNTALDRLGNGNILMRREVHGTKQQYSIDQLRMYSRFDFALRADRLSGPGLIVPAGYSEFCELWAQDRDCRYQFVQYDQITGVIDVVGIHLTADLLAPTRERLTPQLRVHAVKPLPAAPATRLEPRRQAIVDNLIYDHLEHTQRVQDIIRDRRDRKAERAPTTAVGPYTKPKVAMASTGPYNKSKAARERTPRVRPAKTGKGKGRDASTAAPIHRSSGPAAMDIDGDGPVASSSTTSAPEPAAAAAAAASAPMPKKITAGDEDDELIEYHTDDE
ncbi:hypothetical protein C2E23DRAFT_726608 [Lenzites betulinus]|nr:hypothetical protein C2E23DRAFT_726608 [Lenzites betulinus]